jgi:hypothetical protein
MVLTFEEQRVREGFYNLHIFNLEDAVPVRKAYLKVFGLNAGLVLTYLIEYEEKLRDEGEMPEDKYLPEGFEYIDFLKESGFSDKEIEKALAVLFKLEAIKLEVLSMRIQINYNRLYKAIKDNE